MGFAPDGSGVDARREREHIPRLHIRITATTTRDTNVSRTSIGWPVRAAVSTALCKVFRAVRVNSLRRLPGDADALAHPRLGRPPRPRRPYLHRTDRSDDGRNKKVDGHSEPLCQDCRETEMRFHQDDQRESIRQVVVRRSEVGERTAAGTVPVTVWNGGAGRLALRCSDAASAPSAASRTPSFAPSCGQQ